MDDRFTVVSRQDRGGGEPDLVLLASGGVDSAVALAVLREQGLRPFAVTLLLPHFAGLDKNGSPVFDHDDAPGRAAAELARKLDVSHAILDFRQVFRDLVAAPFVASYRSGLTPNPCVRCNPDVKFGLVREWAAGTLGVRVVATGHYASLVERDGRVRLKRSRFFEKDQSYFLYRLPPAELAETRFPLADFADKDAVRRRARELGLAVSEAKDSQDVCFLPDGDYRPLVGGAGEPGPILDEDGREIGSHDGAVNFTIGQRKGLKTGFGKPMYVLAVDPSRNAVVIGPREAAGQRRVVARDLVVHAPDAVLPGASVFAKIRSGGTPRPAVVESRDADRLAVVFAEPVFAPAPGQHLVLYDADGLVLGGGEIARQEEKRCRC